MNQETGAAGLLLKIVWVVSRRGQRAYRTRIGVAWQEPDGSLAARLDAVPLSGELVVTDWLPSSEADAGRELVREPRGGARGTDGEAR